jgi:RNA polymerase sigma-70 factor, ECF subfamily
MPFDAPQPSDSLLIAAVRRGDERSFVLLYRRHTPRLLQVVLRIVGGAVDDAEDVVQEAWIAATAALEGFRGDASFRTWLTGIAINRCRVLLKKRGRWTDIGDSETAIPAAGVWSGERVDLERAISLLPAGYRTVVVLHDVEGYTHDEIAALLGVASGTSKAQLFHARRALRALLEPEPKIRSHTETTNVARY